MGEDCRNCKYINVYLSISVCVLFVCTCEQMGNEFLQMLSKNYRYTADRWHSNQNLEQLVLYILIPQWLDVDCSCYCFNVEIYLVITPWTTFSIKSMTHLPEPSSREFASTSCWVCLLNGMNQPSTKWTVNNVYHC